jgi:CBS domain-containing protein
MACIEKRFVREVVSLEATASCSEAARVMAKHGIGSVGVRRGGKLVGLVTERDLVASVLGCVDSDRTSLGEAMRADQPTVSPRATDRECAELMRSRRTRHLAVKDGAEIVGVVSMLDLVELVVEESEYRIDQLETYIGGGRTRQLSKPLAAVFAR